MERAPKKAKTLPDAPLQLKVVTLRRDYQFVDTAFEVQVLLQSQDGQIATGLGDLSVAVSLAFEGSADAPPQDMLALDSPPLVVNGRAALQVRLTDTSMNVGNRKVCLVVEATENGQGAKGKGGGISPNDVAPARSAPICVIRHKLELDIPAGSWEGQWYKDEGGRDKAISLPVKLVDAAGALVIGREVPLTARLLYESGTAVPDQANVLKVHDSSSAGISRDTGKGELKVRLEQVSRNHNHQDFQVEVLPDTVASPLDLDVGVTTSSSVTVLSKRNRAAVAGAGSSSSRAAASSAPSGAAHRNQRAASHRSSAQHVTATDPVAAAEAVAAARTVVAEAAVPLALPHPQGGAGVQGSMENVLGWIQNALIVMETQAAVLEAAQAQHNALRSTLTAYTVRIQADLQALVADFDSSAAATDHNGNHNTNGSVNTTEPPPPSHPQPLDFGAMPPPPPQPPMNGGLGDPLSLVRPSLIMRQTSSNYFSGSGNVSVDVSVDVEAALHSAPYALMDSGAGAESSAAESSIAYIVAKLFVTAKGQVQEKIGFPAFSTGKQLVGLYREVEPDSSNGGATSDDHDIKIEFLSLSAAQAAGRLSEENVAAGAHSLDRELMRQSKSVFKLDEFNGTLDDMKAAALFYFTEKASGSTTEGRGHSLSIGRGYSEMDTADLELFRQTSDTDPNWSFEL